MSSLSLPALARNVGMISSETEFKGPLTRQTPSRKSRPAGAQGPSLRETAVFAQDNCLTGRSRKREQCPDVQREEVR